MSIFEQSYKPTWTSRISDKDKSGDFRIVCWDETYNIFKGTKYIASEIGFVEATQKAEKYISGELKVLECKAGPECTCKK